MDRPTHTPLPRYLFHWTEASDVESIIEAGLRTSVGGFCSQHEDQPGVNLTDTGWDPAAGWNENIFHLARPVRLTIDTAQLDAELVGPDLNSLLEDGTAAAMLDAGDDPDDPTHQTWQQSLRHSGNCRYLAQISPQAIVEIKGFAAPRAWKLDPSDYGYEHEYDDTGNLLVAADWHLQRWPGCGLTSDQPPPRLSQLQGPLAAQPAPAASQRTR